MEALSDQAEARLRDASGEVSLTAVDPPQKVGIGP